jgi:hypothetical protein
MTADTLISICLFEFEQYETKCEGDCRFRLKPAELWGFPRSKKFVELATHGAIAFTGSVFEYRPIGDGHVAASVLYQSGFL